MLAYRIKTFGFSAVFLFFSHSSIAQLSFESELFLGIKYGIIPAYDSDFDPIAYDDIESFLLSSDTIMGKSSTRFINLVPERGIIWNKIEDGYTFETNRNNPKYLCFRKEVFTSEGIFRYETDFINIRKSDLPTDNTILLLIQSTHPELHCTWRQGWRIAGITYDNAERMLDSCHQRYYLNLTKDGIFSQGFGYATRQTCECEQSKQQDDGKLPFQQTGFFPEHFHIPLMGERSGLYIIENEQIIFLSHSAVELGRFNLTKNSDNELILRNSARNAEIHLIKSSMW